MEPPARTPRLLLLATAGWILCAVAFLMLLSHSLSYGRGSAVQEGVGYALGAIGLACHVAAIALSVRAWRRRGGVPGVALSYLALPVLWAVGGAYSRYSEARLYRDNPGLLSAEPSRDGLGLDVRNASGTWHVPLDACPNALSPSGELGTRSQQGVVEVLNPDDTPYMRLHVAGRRVECLPGDASAAAP